MLRVPWTSYRVNVSILEELNTQKNGRLIFLIQCWILEFFGHIIRRDSLEKKLLKKTCKIKGIKDACHLDY